MWHPLGFDNWQRQLTDRARSKRAVALTKNAGSVFEQRLRWSRRGEAHGWGRVTAEPKRVNPPHRHITEMRACTQSTGFLFYILRWGMRTLTGVRQLTMTLRSIVKARLLLHTINSAAKMFANTIPSSAFRATRHNENHIARMVYVMH